MEQQHPEELGFSHSRLEQVTRVAQDYVDRGEISGVVIGIARDGALGYLDAFGRSSIEAERQMTPDTLFRIYSMTKPITSAATMLLIERAELRLEDPVARYFPEFTEMQVYSGGDEPPFLTVPAREPILIRHLLTHTAGLAYGIGDDHPVEHTFERAVWGALATDPEKGLSEVATLIASVPLVHEPGSAWRYSASCDLLAAVVEKVSGVPFAEFLAREFFGPLGMPNTWFTVPESERDRLAIVYTPGENGLAPAPDPPIMAYTAPRNHPSGGGGLVSTAEDYLRFCQMLLDDGRVGDDYLLSPHTVEQMTTNHLPADLPGWGRSGSGFGYGGEVVTDLSLFPEYGSVGRFSWGGAASTLFWVDPAERLAAVFMLQRVPGFSSLVTNDLYTSVYQAIVG